MKLPISDLMEACTAEDISIETHINTEAVKQTVLSRIQAEPPKRKRFKPSILLVAAAVMALLVGTAVATPTVLSGREVTDTDETFHYDYHNGKDIYYESYYEDAGYVIEFDIPEDATPQDHHVEFRLGWLPEEYEGVPITPIYYTLNEWAQGQVGTDLGLLEEFGEYIDIIPYQVNVWGKKADSFETKYYLNGETTLVKQDNWNGWNRMELTVDYTNSNALRWEYPVNYLLLYDPEENIFVNICGMMDLETLEQIAEHMEVRVTDELCQHVPSYEHKGPSVAMLDLSRG